VVVLLPLLITMMSCFCAVPDRLQSTLSYYPFCGLIYQREGRERWRGESSDTATCCCRLTQAT
jgi:hypothetical protein